METESGAEFISEAHVRHIMRYVQARDWLTTEKIVVDAACGTGYGTNILSKNHIVLGVDNNEDALKEAVKNYNSTFIKHDLLKPIYRCRADAVVCIETIEHLKPSDGKKLLTNFKLILEDRGILIISTPYCEVSGPSPITKQHMWEYSLTNFEQTLHEEGFAIDQMKIDRHDGQFGRRGYCMAKAIKR